MEAVLCGDGATTLPGDPSPLGGCGKTLWQSQPFSKRSSLSALGQNPTALHSSSLKYTGLDIKLD